MIQGQMMLSFSDIMDNIGGVPVNVVKDILKRGSNFENGKKRIIDIFNEGKDVVSLIKKEYGIGGSHWAVKYLTQDNEGRYTVYVDNDIHAIGYSTFGKGIKMEWVDNKVEHEKELSWSLICKEIGNLIRNGEYEND